MAMSCLATSQSWPSRSCYCARLIWLKSATLALVGAPYGQLKVFFKVTVEFACSCAPLWAKSKLYPYC